jgi:ring-1,2-phenylacetyl-CoA epoxidase subunit PaaE
MSKFHPLRVARVEPETRDAVAITFAVPPELRESFRYREGQHLTLRTSINGADFRRSYSICSAVHDDCLRIAVKRNPGGIFSAWANETLREGDTLEVMPPRGHFNVTLEPQRARRYLAFAAGSGITPILSIVKTILAVEPGSSVTLFYGNRASSTVMFKEELCALKDTYLSRFSVLHVLSREAQDIPLLNGRIDRQKADALLAHWISDLNAIDTAFVCGPDGMMCAVADALKGRGFPEAKIRIERFATSIPHHEHTPKPVEPGHAQCEVTAIIDGAAKSFVIDRSKENIVDGALRNGIELPYSCKGGVCSTCRAKVVSGQVDMDVNFALEDYEIARGFVLTCQSYPVTERVTVDYDQTA